MIKKLTIEPSFCLKSLLRPKTGIFIYLTWMQPHFRAPYIERQEWTLETRTLGDAFHYFLYIARKH